MLGYISHFKAIKKFSYTFIKDDNVAYESGKKKYGMHKLAI